MADIIKVSAAEMQATISRYNEAMNSMADAQNNMKSALNNLNGCWKGVAWAAMMAKWTQIEANILHTQEAVNRSVLALQNTINYYTTGEDTAKATGSALEVGTQATIYVD